VPTEVDAIRTGSVTESDFAGIAPEALLDYANSLPESEPEVLRNVDLAAEEAGFRAYFETALSQWQGIVPIPNFWDLGGHFPLYGQFGYEAFLSACALFPEAVHKIWWVRSLRSRERAKIMAGLYAEYSLPPLMFCGEDLCVNHGPMISPTFIRKQYLPTVAMIIEPLVDSGIRVLYHCDGDVRSMVQEFMDIGYSGFQGFQYEDHVEIADLRKLRSRLGEEPLIFAGLSVSRTLPFGNVEDVREEVDYFINATDGGRGLYLFTSNVTGVEVEPDNIRGGNARIKEYDSANRGPSKATVWPWGARHPDCFSAKK
jgi:hypothetical protein